MWQQMAPLHKITQLYLYLYSLSHFFKPNSLAALTMREIKAQPETARWGSYRKGIPALIRGPRHFYPGQRTGVKPVLLVSPQKWILES